MGGVGDEVTLFLFVFVLNALLDFYFCAAPQ